MNKTQIIRYIILAVAVIASHVGRSIIWDNDGIEFADTVDYVGIVDELLILLEEVDEGTVKAIEFKADNTLLEHSDKIDLQGELGFTGLEGDMIIVRKTGGRWIEIGRYLKE